MNTKAYSILFSCLLASTFFHEFNAKSVVGPARPLKALEGRQKRATTVPTLTLSSPASNILVITNETASASLIIDLEVNLFLLLNGTTGSGICLNQNGTEGAFISSGLWNATNQTVAEYLETIEFDLSVLLEISGAVLFDLTTVTEEILLEITYIVICLVATLDLELLADITLALELVLSVVGVILVLLNGVLEGLIGLIGEVVIVLYVDIAGLACILQGLATILSLVAGTLLQAIEKGVELELAVILGAVDGLVCLVNLILQLGVVLDLSVLVSILGDPESLCRIIAQLGGNIFIGISGLFLVLADLLGLISGSVTVVQFINCLIQFVAQASKEITTDLVEQLNEELQLLIDAIAEVNATVILATVVTTVTALLNGTLVVAGISISIIVKTLLAGLVGPVSGLLTLVVTILILLAVVISPSVSILYLLVILIVKLNSPLGIQQLLALGIDLGRGGCICKLLSSILLGVVNLLVLLLTGDLYGVLIGLPVIGNVVVALNVAVNAAAAAAGIRLNLRTLLNASTLIKNLLKGVIQIVTGIVTGVLPTVIIQARALLESCISLYAYVRIVIFISVSV